MDEAHVAHRAPLQITSNMIHFLKLFMFFGSSSGSRTTSYGSLPSSSFLAAVVLGASDSARSAAVYSETSL